MRFTLGKMFLAVGMLALACAAVIYHSHWWVVGIVTLTAVMYVLTLLVAMASSGRQRLLAMAFVVVGGGYVLFMAFDGFASIRDSLPTNHLLSLIWEFVGGKQKEYGGHPEGKIQDTVYRVYHDPKALGYYPSQLFTIGHCVFSWIFAVLAAWFAGRMWDRREQAAKEVA